MIMIFSVPPTLFLFYNLLLWLTNPRLTSARYNSILKSGSDYQREGEHNDA